MTLGGYKAYLVNPFEAASNYPTPPSSRATSTNTTTDTAMTRLNFPSDTYNLVVNYCDRKHILCHGWIVE